MAKNFKYNGVTKDLQTNDFKLFGITRRASDGKLINSSGTILNPTGYCNSLKFNGVTQQIWNTAPSWEETSYRCSGTQRISIQRECIQYGAYKHITGATREVNQGNSTQCGYVPPAQTYTITATGDGNFTASASTAKEGTLISFTCTDQGFWAGKQGTYEILVNGSVVLNAVFQDFIPTYNIIMPAYDISVQLREYID